MTSPIPEKFADMVVLDAEKDIEKIAGMVDFVFCAVNMKKDEIKALEEMKENLLVALAKGCCRNVSRSEVHDLIDEIYDEYEIDN